MFETPATKSIKRIFTTIFDGSEDTPKFSDRLLKYSTNEARYNPKQVLEMLRALKKMLRDGMMKLSDEENFMGIKNFVKEYNIDLIAPQNYEKLAVAINNAAESFAEKIQQNIDNVLIENIRLRSVSTLNDTRVVSQRELNKVLVQVLVSFKHELYESFSAEVAQCQQELSANATLESEQKEREEALS